MPDWVTHILNVRDGTASTIPFASSSFSDLGMEVIQKDQPINPVPPRVGDVVVDTKDVNVAYGTKKVTNDRSWRRYINF